MPDDNLHDDLVKRLVEKLKQNLPDLQIPPAGPPRKRPGPPKEYPLPALDLPEEFRARLDPWIAGFIGLTPDEASARLAARWAGIARPSLQAIRKSLLSFDVVALVDFQDGGSIRGFREKRRRDFGDSNFYLPAPLPDETLRDRMRDVGLGGDDALFEFLQAFAGLCEGAHHRTQFVRDADTWLTFSAENLGFMRDHVENFAEWENALRFYHALNGCEVLVRADGKVGWWMMQEGHVRDEAKTLDGFFRSYARYPKSWPFDPYGPPEREPEEEPLVLQGPQFITAFQREKISENEFHRKAMEHVDWWMDAAVAECYARETSAENAAAPAPAKPPVRACHFFTHEAAAKVAVKKGLIPGPVVGGFAGSRIFAELPAECRAVSINPGSRKTETHEFAGKSLALACRWAREIRLERWLARPDSPAKFAAMRDFEGYYVIMQPGEDRLGTTVGRTLKNDTVLVFCSRDQAEKFEDIRAKMGGALKTSPMTGRELFQRLRAQKIKNLVIGVDPPDGKSYDPSAKDFD